MKTGLALIVVLCVATATFPCFEAKQELLATRRLMEFDSTTDFESGEVSTDRVAEPGRSASVQRKLRQNSAAATAAAAARASGGSASSFAAGAARANGGGGSASAASAARARANGNSASAFSAARARAGAGNSGFFPFIFPFFFG